MQVITRTRLFKNRYQYHKRIRSETGNTIINPLEQLNDKYGKGSGGMTGAPTITKTTDITTPLVPGEDHRFSINDKSNSNGASTINTVQLSKYEFAPSFTHHKNISLDSNVQYRKFTTNKNPSNSHKIDISKIKKSQKYKGNENKVQAEERSVPQFKKQSPIKFTKKAENQDRQNNYSPALIDFRSGSNDNYIEGLQEVEKLLNDESFNEYDLNRGLFISEQQSKIETKKAQQLEGDHTISMSKETDEFAYLTNSKQGSYEPIQILNNIDNQKTSDKQKENRKEIEYNNFKKTVESQEIKAQFEQNKVHTKIVQIDCQSLNPCEMTKSKDGLIEYIKSYINESGKEPDTKAKFYRVGKLLGRGAFGKVSLGMHKATNQLIAIKSINKEFLEEERSRRKVAKEVAILKKLQHKNIMNLYETFETEKHYLLVTELCAGGDLLSYVRRRRKLTEDYAKFFFKQLVEACIYCHKKGVVHRDIKLDNILLDHKGVLKLGDFGVSREVK